VLVPLSQLLEALVVHAVRVCFDQHFGELYQVYLRQALLHASDEVVH
jgi:hypothetical protein